MSESNAGRPSKYKPEFCQELDEHMAEGYSLESFAGRIGVCRDTLHEWSKVHSEFSDAIKVGKGKAQLKWEEKLHMAVTNPKGINATPILFALKCRFGYKETVVNEHSGLDGKPIEHKNLSDIPDEALDARVAAIMDKFKGKNESGN